MLKRSRNLKLLEHQEPHQACSGKPVPFTRGFCPVSGRSLSSAVYVNSLPHELSALCSVKLTHMSFVHHVLTHKSSWQHDLYTSRFDILAKLATCPLYIIFDTSAQLTTCHLYKNNTPFSGAGFSQMVVNSHVCGIPLCIPVLIVTMLTCV